MSLEDTISSTPAVESSGVLTVERRRPLDLSGSRNRAMSERIIGFFLFLCGALSILTTIGIIGVLIVETVEFFRRVSLWEYISSTTFKPNRDAAKGDWGMWPLVSATLSYAIIGLLLAVPVGICIAIYLSEYAPLRVRTVVKPILELLAGVPTIVYGFFALTFITPDILQRFDSQIGIFNVLGAGLTIGVLIIPLVASLSEDAMRAVPGSLREGAFALGATKFETSMRVILPAAISGVVASVILALGRAIGETMIVVIAGGAQTGGVPTDLTGSAQSMTSYIVNVLGGEASRSDTRYYSLFAIGFTLLIITLILNLISRAFIRRFREVYQ
jgi:phosphate transport system permease protein